MLRQSRCDIHQQRGVAGESRSTERRTKSTADPTRRTGKSLASGDLWDGENPLIWTSQLADCSRDTIFCSFTTDRRGVRVRGQPGGLKQKRGDRETGASRVWGADSRQNVEEVQPVGSCFSGEKEAVAGYIVDEVLLLQRNSSKTF